MKRLLTLTCFLAAAASCHAFEAYIEGDGRFFDFRQGGGATLWAPVHRTGDSVLFGQAHAGYYRKNLTVGTIGGGYRKLIGAGGFGVNGFFDYAKSDRGRSFYQGGVGAEAFTACWLGRVNGYVPTAHRRGPFVRGSEVIGTQVLDVDRRGRFELGYGGFDAELGRCICLFGGELWGYGGGYRFKRGTGRAISGPRFRAEYTYYQPKRLIGWAASIGGEYTYDRVHKSQGSLLVRLRMPLFGSKKGCSCIPRLCRRLVEPVRRQESVWVERSKPEAKVLDFIQNLFFFSQSGTGPGTQASPTNLAGATGAAGPGDILFALSDDGDIVGSITMQTAQQLAGFGDGDTAILLLNNGQELTVDKLNPAGIRPTITDAGTAVTVSGASDVRLFGVELDNTQTSTTLSLVNANNFDIDDLVVTNFGSSLVKNIFNMTSANGSISNSQFEYVAGIGSIIAGFNMGDLIFVDNEVSSSNNGPGLTFTPNANVVVRRNTISTGGPGGFSVTGPSLAPGFYDISNNTITTDSFQALRISTRGGGDWTVTNNVLVGGPFASNQGISVQPYQNPGVQAVTMDISNNQITSGGPGIETGGSSTFNPVSGVVNLTMIGNSVTNTAGTSYSVGHDASVPANDATNWCLTIQNNSSTLTPGTALEVNPTASVGTTAIFPSNVPAALISANNFAAGAAVIVNPPDSLAPNPCPLPILPTE